MLDPFSFPNFDLFMLVDAAMAGKNDVAVGVFVVFVETVVVVEGKVEVVVVVVDFVVVTDSAVVGIVLSVFVLDGEIEAIVVVAFDIVDGMVEVVVVVMVLVGLVKINLEATVVVSS